jgi:zinc protease
MSKVLDRSRVPEPGPIRDYAFPAVDTRTLDNGIRSLVCHAGDIPLVTAHIIVDAGAATEPAAKAGLATLMANSLEGGTTTRSGAELAWALEELGLELSAWATWDAIHIRATATTDRIDHALALLADIVRQPAFPAQEVERSRDEQLAEMLQRVTEPRALADDMAVRHIFDKSSAYARSVYGTTDTVRTLTADDARELHRARVCPDTTAVILAGDVTAATGHELVARVFGDWQGTAQTAAAVDPHSDIDATTIFLVDRPGSVQSEVRIGHVGVPRNSTDHNTLIVGNAVLGGVFTSRLNLSLREKHGFTYGVRSHFSFRRAAGPFLISTAVGTEVTSRAVQETFAELNALLRDGPTDTEVNNARDYLAGIFPLQLQSTEELAARLSEIVVYGLPQDYFEHYRNDLLRVECDAVAAAMRQHVRPDAMAVVIVGDAAGLRSELEALGIGPVVVESGTPTRAAAND